MADCQAQLQDPEIAEVEAALIEEHQVGGRDTPAPAHNERGESFSCFAR